MSAKGKRREQGTGTVYHESGRHRWVGAVTIAGRRRKVTGKTEAEASRKLRKLVSAKDTGNHIDNRRITVADAVNVFIERNVPNRTSNGQSLAPATVDTYRWAADILTNEICNIRIAALAVDDVEAMLDRLAKRRERPLSAASLRKVRGTLDRALAFAVRRGDIARNVAQHATIPPTATATKRRRSLSPDDARKLLAALPEERNGAMFALGLRVGLRPGEAAGVYWSDLHGDTLNVTRAVRRIGGRAEVVDDLKTSDSKRTIQLPNDLVTMLGEHRAKQNVERMESEEWTDSRLMFAGTTGNVLSPSTTRLLLVDICERSGVPTIRPNELRHSCASLLADIGVPNEAIADLLGHTSTRMVDSTYRHRLRPVVSIAAEADWTKSV